MYSIGFGTSLEPVSERQHVEAYFTNAHRFWDVVFDDGHVLDGALRAEHSATVATVTQEPQFSSCGVRTLQRASIQNFSLRGPHI